ncbi:helix-turn-helix domain-containing protein [Nocardiopsis coralliicola]
MAEIIDFGPTLRSKRGDLGWSQDKLAEKSGLTSDYIGRLERGERTASLQALMDLARALDCDPGDLTGKRPRMERVGDATVTAVRDAVYDPHLLLPGTPDVEPETPAELMRIVERGYGAYFTGEFGALAALVPDLLARCRSSEAEHGQAAVAAPYAHAYDLASALLVHTGRVDAALAGVERAILTARNGDDEYRPTSFLGTYAWVLLHQGRYAAAEDLVVRAAEGIAPRMGEREPRRLSAWGGLLMQAAVVAGSDGRSGDAKAHLRAANSAAVQMDGDRRDYWISFGPTQLAVQATHIHTVLEQPTEALKASRRVDRRELMSIQWGRHLLDVAKSHELGRRTDEAIAAARAAQSVSDEWFRHQRVAASLVKDLRQRKARPPEPLAEMIATLQER